MHLFVELVITEVMSKEWKSIVQICHQENKFLFLFELFLKKWILFQKMMIVINPFQNCIASGNNKAWMSPFYVCFTENQTRLWATICRNGQNFIQFGHNTPLLGIKGHQRRMQKKMLHLMHWTFFRIRKQSSILF